MSSGRSRYILFSKFGVVLVFGAVVVVVLQFHHFVFGEIYSLAVREVVMMEKNSISCECERDSCECEREIEKPYENAGTYSELGVCIRRDCVARDQRNYYKLY